ncbi:MAG: TonB-dependent receptor [Lewinella sp.]|nr:TonB-dependent receptor [Lewinella sp.]
MPINRHSGLLRSRRLLWTALVLFFLPINAALVLAQTPDDQLRSDTLTGAMTSWTETPPLLPLSYGAYPAEEATGAVTVVRPASFNQGLISDPLLLLQAKVPGVQIYHRGGDPNEASLIRIRGLSAFSQRQPLYVVDGLAGASLANIDPNDIASMTVLKDGSAQARYGIRASNGVVLITTKDGALAHQPLSVSYTGQAAGSVAYPGLPVMDQAAFLTAGGIDFVGSTDWLEEVRRTGFSHTHGLAVQGNRGSTHYRISGNYRQVNGVLQKSGFKQANVRAHAGGSLLHDKLSWQLSGAYTDRSSQLGFPEAFRYAQTHNPTAPVRAEDAPFDYNPFQTGGYYELIGLFDDFNPKALVAQNERDGKTQVFNGVAQLNYVFSEQWSAHARYGYQDNSGRERAYYSPRSYFRGNAFSPHDSLRGRADLLDIDDSFSLYELFATYQPTFGASRMSLTLGTSYTNGRHEDRGMILGGFADDEILNTPRIGDFDNWTGRSSRLDTTMNGWTDQLSAFFGMMHLNFRDRFFVDASLRYEGSSRLGADNRWGLFPGLGVAVELGDHLPGVDQFKLRAGYGVTGALPDQAGLAREQLEIRVFPDSTVSEVARLANPGLGWERKTEVNLGLDVAAGPWTAYFEWYQRRVSDWIMADPFAFFPVQYRNQNALKTSGFELGVDYAHRLAADFQYQTGLRLATYRTTFVELTQDFQPLVGQGGIWANPYLFGVEGEAMGTILGPEFTGVDEFGVPVFADLNGDGFIVSDPYSVGTPESDVMAVGNGLPAWEWGWSHQFRYRSWSLQAFFRGALGHSLANRFRQLHEPRPEGTLFYNLVDTDLAREDLRVSRFSSLYVERADFIKLDYLSLGKVFFLATSRGQLPLELSLTAQNLLLASRYSGPDPEPALEDIGRTDNGGIHAPTPLDRLAPGIDRRNSYLPARTFVLGVRLGF